jgi:hypothetical protein
MIPDNHDQTATNAFAEILALTTDALFPGTLNVGILGFTREQTLISIRRLAHLALEEGYNISPQFIQLMVEASAEMIQRRSLE